MSGSLSHGSLEKYCSLCRSTYLYTNSGISCAAHVQLLQQLTIQKLNNNTVEWCFSLSELGS